MKKFYIILVLLFIFLTNVFANNNITDKDIENFIKNMGTQSQEILNNKKLSDKQKENEYKSFTEKIVDCDWVARFILGSNWKTLNENQKNEFKLLYKEYLLSNYIPKLKDYNKSLNIEKVIKQKDTVYMVYTTTKDSTDRNINVNFRVIVKNNNFYITDIIPEGISFISSQRSDVNNSISQNGYENFIQQLKSKIKK